MNIVQQWAQDQATAVSHLVRECGLSFSEANRIYREANYDLDKAMMEARRITF